MRIEEDIKLDYADVLFRPKRSTLSSRKDVELKRTYKFKYSNHQWSGIPIIAANMDGVGEIEVAKNLAKFEIMTCLTKQHDIKIIKSLYSNLNTISFWNLENEIKILENRGYSTRAMKTKLQRSLAFPFFLLSMVLLSGVFTLGKRSKENNLPYVFIAIITSVLIFYFNDFSAALGKTEKLPIEVSVWMPIVIIFIFGAAGLIHANQK